jgi:DNA mismatch endonuclease (patch repair protein)
VHGCFWHGHECPLFKWPATRTDFWRQKISENRRRDKRSIDCLREDGWRVMVVWECAFKGRSRLENGVPAVLVSRWLQSSMTIGEIRGQDARLTRSNRVDGPE